MVFFIKYNPQNQFLVQVTEEDQGLQALQLSAPEVLAAQ